MSDRKRDIAALAYAHRQERGHPIGSPEEDWFRAEERLRLRTSTETKAD